MSHYTTIEVINRPNTEAGLQTCDVIVADREGNAIRKTITTPIGQFRQRMAERYPGAKITYAFDTSHMDEFMDPEQDQ